MFFKGFVISLLSEFKNKSQSKNQKIMKRIILIKNVAVLAALFLTFNLAAQIKEVSIRANADATLLKDMQNFNAGYDYSNQLCNYDSVGPYGGTDSPEESWIRWDLSEIESQIGEGEEILYAEVELLISWNSSDPNVAQGYRALYLKDAFDYWVEGNGISDGSQLDNLNGITWNSALQIGDFEDPSNHDTIFVKERAGVVPEFEKFEVTEQIKSELNDGKNKVLTLRMVPYFNDPNGRKKWLGFLTLQSNNAPGWGANLPLDDEGYPLYSPHIKVYIGKQINKFSDYGAMGDIRNYSLKPDKFGYWMVAEDEGSDRLQIMKKTSIDTTTWVPAAVAVFNDSTYQDFDISVKAKMNYTTPSGAFFPFNDFIMIFGYEDPDNFTYFAFYGDNESGVYKVTDGIRSQIGETSAQPALSDTLYHTYRLTRTGTEVTAYIDGESYFTVNDNGIGTNGKIGLGSHNDVVFFDDFTDGREPSAIFEKASFRTVIYPNPVINKIAIHTEKPMTSVKVINVLGNTIYSKDRINSSNTTIDLSDVPQGIYFIVTEVNGVKKADKIIKQK